MAYDNIKLEKGLYTTGKGFTKELEALDPSENYIGTELEGLDAFERQLKRFDIKIAGSNSDTISKFFLTTDSSALFPEYISRAVKVGIDENDALDKLIATTTEIDSLDYRSIESVPSEEDKTLAVVNEGTFIPETKIKVKDTLTKLTKRGRMLVASYEAIKFQKLDLFTITLKQIGNAIAKAEISEIINDCFNNSKSVSGTGSTITYSDLVDLWASLNPYNLTTMIANTKELVNILNMDEFKDSNAGLDFHGTGSVVTPFGASIVRSEDIEDGCIFALDKNYAVEKVVAGGVMTEYDKLIDRQLERATISTISGFSTIFDDATSILDAN